MSATIVINVPDDNDYTRIQNAVSAILGYDPNSTLTQDQQVHQHMCDFLSQTVSAHEQGVAYQNAMASVTVPAPVTLS